MISIHNAGRDDNKAEDGKKGEGGDWEMGETSWAKGCQCLEFKLSWQHSSKGKNEERSEVRNVEMTRCMERGLQCVKKGGGLR